MLMDYLSYVSHGLHNDLDQLGWLRGHSLTLLNARVHAARTYVSSQ